MAKLWYPVVDIQECAECGACVRKCPHGVFDKGKAPIPVIIYPENCIDHCHGCGNQCPKGAITYVGDDTGWKPPHGRTMANVDCCCGTEKRKRVLVEYLYLDLNTCDRCIGTVEVLDKVMEVLTPALEIAGYEVIYKKIHITSLQEAENRKFLSSPTICVNGQDIFSTIRENDCGCCSDISGIEVRCRVFEYGDKTYEVLSTEMAADAILKRIYLPAACSCCEYEVPENLKRFFAGKDNRSSCQCGNQRDRERS